MKEFLRVVKKEGLKMEESLRLLPLSVSAYKRWEKAEKIEKREHQISEEEISKAVGLLRSMPQLGGKKLRITLIHKGEAYLTVRESQKIVAIFKELSSKKEEKVKSISYEFGKIHSAWSMDFTYLEVYGEIIYICAVLEEHSRKVLSWGWNRFATAEFVLGTYLNAVLTTGVIPGRLKTDRGKQFKAEIFQMVEKMLRQRHLWNPPHYAQYNAHCERIFYPIKVMIRARLPEERAEDKELSEIIRGVIEDYNNLPHKKLKWISPNDMYEGRGKEVKERMYAYVEAEQKQRKEGKKEYSKESIGYLVQRALANNSNFNASVDRNFIGHYRPPCLYEQQLLCSIN